MGLYCHQLISTCKPLKGGGGLYTLQTLCIELGLHHAALDLLNGLSREQLDAISCELLELPLPQDRSQTQQEVIWG